jgi:hypothetical protein
MSVPFHKQTDASKPPGQVVYPIPEQFLHQYIEKKDDSPKRITFDEWYKTDEAQLIEQEVHNECSSFEEVEKALKMLWNTAIKQGKISP